MQGPYDKMFGNTPFDLNHDGKIDARETAFLYDTVLKDSISDLSGDTFNDGGEWDDDLEDAGIDRDELELMDEDERREALEDVGFDPDDFEDEF